MAMTDFSTPYYASTKKATQRRLLWIPYLLLGILGNAAMWSLASYYLKVAPRAYTSNWVLTLPDQGASTEVSLPNIGGATSRAASPYGNNDPRENYKFIISSQPVREAAAAKLNLSTGEYGSPQIKIIDNSTLISFEFEGDTPQEAQAKAIALNEAFNERLNELRVQQAAQEEVKVQATLADAQKKLATDQARLSDYQARSGLTSEVQIDQLSANIEQLRKQRAEVTAQQQQSRARLGQLSNNLKISAPQAADAFVLKADQLFQQYGVDYSTATAALAVLNAKYGPNHPVVVRERSKQNSAQAALIARSQALLGRPADSTILAQLNLGGSEQGGTARETLFQDLVTVQVEEQGLQASAQELDRQIFQLEARLKNLAQLNTNLDALRRNMQISETVFSSTVAKLDLGKSDIFGSYPPVQLLTEPSLPDSPSSPKTTLVLLGAGVGSVFFTLGLITLWLYQERRNQFNNKTLDTHKQMTGA
jgi:uncharacterized protein involved in exopolysaccharide biosynthesis